MAKFVYIVANSPYYQVLTAMAQEAGLEVKKSFNCEYETWLPKSNGHVLIVETHNGKPILDLKLLDQHVPGASNALSYPNGLGRIGDTTVVFLDFTKILGNLNL